MKLLMFDLKNTLVYSDGLCPDFAGIASLVQSAGYVLGLYSINERWTYQTLARNAQAFSAFPLVLLVANKETPNIRALTREYDIAGMVGDGEAEQSIAAMLGIPFLQVQKELTEPMFKRWLEGLAP